MTVTLQDAINVIQAGDTARGKALLAKVLQQDPNNEAAWIWMSGTVEDIYQRRYCLEKALEINPANAAAQAGLLRLGFQPPNAVPPTPLARRDHGLGQPSTGEPEAVLREMWLNANRGYDLTLVKALINMLVVTGALMVQAIPNMDFQLQSGPGCCYGIKTGCRSWLSFNLGSRLQQGFDTFLQEKNYDARMGRTEPESH